MVRTFYRRVASSDEEDCVDSDDGSVVDLEGEELADTIVSVRGDVPMSPVLQATDKGVVMIPPVADRPVQWTVSGSVGWNVKTDDVSVVSWPMCVRPICMYVVNTAKTYTMRMCLLYPDAGNLKSGSVDSQRLDHWRTVIWVLFRTDCDVLGPSLGRVVCMDWARCLVLPGKNGIYHGCIHPVLWIGCVVIIRRSKYL